jgi:hypothetical protein
MTSRWKQGSPRVRVAPDSHVLELVREHRRAVYGDRAPYSLLSFMQRRRAQ